MGNVDTAFPLLGGSFFFVEIVLRDFQPSTVVFLRVSLAAVILLGVVYIRGQRMPASLKMWRGLGQIAVLGAAVSYSFAGIFGKRLKNTSAIVNATGMLICSSIIMLPFAMLIDSPWTLRPSLEAIAAVSGIAIISTAVAYLLYFGILASAGATKVLLVTFLIPISALLLGVGVLGEVIRILEYTQGWAVFSWDSF